MEGYGEFEAGDRVLEVDGGLIGTIAEKGKYPGEWFVPLTSGETVVCLAENLRLSRSEHDNSGQREA